MVMINAYTLRSPSIMSTEEEEEDDDQTNEERVEGDIDKVDDYDDDDDGVG